MAAQKPIDQLPSVTPSVSLVIEARERWKRICASEEERSSFENNVRRRFARKWEFSWTKDELSLQANFPFAKGTAALSESSPRSDFPAFRLCSYGTRLQASVEASSHTIDELAYIMAELVQVLGWGRGEPCGGAEFVSSYRRHSSLYEIDFYTWAIETARKIREKRFDELEPGDWEFVAEEIDDLGKSQRDALRSQMIRLLLHMLKWRYASRAGHENSWRASIKSARTEVEEILEHNPGLKSQKHTLFQLAYPKSVIGAVEETNMPESAFPATLPWTYEQAMKGDFMPQSGDAVA